MWWHGCRRKGEIWNYKTIMKGHVYIGQQDLDVLIWRDCCWRKGKTWKYKTRVDVHLYIGQHSLDTWTYWDCCWRKGQMWKRKYGLNVSDWSGVGTVWNVGMFGFGTRGKVWKVTRILEDWVSSHGWILVWDISRHLTQICFALRQGTLFLEIGCDSLSPLISRSVIIVWIGLRIALCRKQQRDYPFRTVRFPRPSADLS